MKRILKNFRPNKGQHYHQRHQQEGVADLTGGRRASLRDDDDDHDHDDNNDIERYDDEYMADNDAGEGYNYGKNDSYIQQQHQQPPPSSKDVVRHYQDESMEDDDTLYTTTSAMNRSTAAATSRQQQATTTNSFKQPTNGHGSNSLNHNNDNNSIQSSVQSRTTSERKGYQKKITTTTTVHVPPPPTNSHQKPPTSGPPNHHQQQKQQQQQQQLLRNDETRHLVKQFIAAIWNRGELDLIPDVCSPSLRFNGNTGFDRVGHDGLARMVATIRDALDEYHCEIHSMVVEDNKAFCRLRFTGKHVGPLLGHRPTHKTVAWMGATEFTCQNGKILKVWELGDVKSLEEQLATAASTSPSPEHAVE